MTVIVSKFDAARIQLDQAIECFFAGNHICAITLAGAAEDILNALIESTGRGDVGAFTFLHEFYQRKTGTQVPAKIFSREIANPVRNWLKHGKDDADTSCEIGERDSVFMFMRAVPAYTQLTNHRTVNMQKFFDYYENNKTQIESLFS